MYPLNMGRVHGTDEEELFLPRVGPVPIVAPGSLHLKDCLWVLG